jgi:hypothetical protein
MSYSAVVYLRPVEQADSGSRGQCASPALPTAASPSASKRRKDSTDIATARAAVVSTTATSTESYQRSLSAFHRLRRSSASAPPTGVVARQAASELFSVVLWEVMGFALNTCEPIIKATRTVPPVDGREQACRAPTEVAMSFCGESAAAERDLAAGHTFRRKLYRMVVLVPTEGTPPRRYQES